MKKKQASSQGELTDNPNDKDPFRRKQQLAVSGERRVPLSDGRSVPQLKANLGFAETAHSSYGRVKGKEIYKDREMPRICVEMAKRLKGRTYK